MGWICAEHVIVVRRTFRQVNMAQSSRTFRIFVSSTFSDLKAERNALQEKVFPRLRDLATAHGCRFQVIDLRWGVSEEAALDQQTMKICLGEIERCQKTSPRPNFIVLLGNRYGWCPLPYDIPADEFEQIIPPVLAEERSLVEEWYHRDDNAVPPVYCLQPRTGEFEGYSAWENVELRLHTVLEDASQKAGFSSNQLLKYTASATEQEIVAGALDAQDAGKHVFGFFREIKDFPRDKRSEGFGELDAAAAEKQGKLKERLKEQLPGNVHEYPARWQGDGPSLDHLDQLCEDVYADLSKVILSEIGHLEAVDPLEKEIVAHNEFGEDRARIFIGRTDILKAIADYIKGNNSHPLAVWGPSGSGKSALMAKAVEQARLNGKDVIYRFIGATPDSSNGRALLESLCKQISRRYGADETAIPSEYKDLVQEFPKHLALARPEEPLIIFLDALDQLSDSDNARSLVWLPADLPPNVRLIVSTLPGECLKALEGRLPEHNRQEVQPMSVEDGKAILSPWLKEAHRKLQDDQEQYLLGRFKDCGLPLYLKLAVEEARQWKSYSIPELSESISGILQDLFKRLSQESNHGSMLVSRSLGYLVAAKNGLSEDELLDVLSLDKELLADFQRRSPKSPKVERLPVVVWSRLYFDLEPYLTERSADGVSLMTFYHRQMAEACQAAYRDKARHARLAEYFNSQPLYLEKDEKAPNLRKLSEMVYQQAWAGLSTQVEKTLLDYTYLQAKLAGQGVQELIDDYALIPKAGVNKEKEKSLSLLQGALRLSAHVLSKDPLQLPGQLTGRLLGIEVSELKALLEQIQAEVKRPWLRPLFPCLTPPGGSELYTLVGTTISGIKALAITPDGKLAVSGSYRDLKVWDLEFGIERFTLTGHFAEVNCVAITPDGRLAVSGTDLRENSIKVWNLRTGKELFTLKGHSSRVFSVAITSDGRRAVSASADNMIKVWDLENGVELFSLPTQQEAVRSIAIASNGQLAVSTASKGGIRVWNLATASEVYTLTGHNPLQVVRAVAVTPDGKLAVSGSGDKTVKVWDLENRRELFTLAGHTDSVISVAITPDGKTAVSGSDDRTIKIWDLETGIERATLTGHTHSVEAVTITSDGRRVVSSSDDKTIKIWDLDTIGPSPVFSRHEGVVEVVAVSPNGQMVVSGSNDKTIKIWDLKTGIENTTLVGHIQEISNIVFTPDGRSAISSSHDGTLKVWNLQAGSLKCTLSGQAALLFTVAITPDGRLVVSCSENKILEVWDLDTCQRKFILTGHTDRVSDVAITPDGRSAISASWDKTLKVWDLETGKERFNLTGHEGSVQAVAITPDGRRALSASFDLTLKTWDLETGSEIHTLVGHKSWIYDVAISPDGQIAVSSADDGDSKVWDLISGTLRFNLTGHTGRINNVVFSPDGRAAVSGSLDNTLKVWDLSQGCCIATYPADSGIWGKPGIVSTPFTIVFGDQSGRMYFLRMANFSLKEFIVTAWSYQAAPQAISARPSLAFGCSHCRTWVEIQKSVLGTEIPCPNCGKQVKLNPFTIQGDWRPIAKAWQGEQ